MASTFEDILKSYVRKINEEWGNITEDSGTDVTNILARLNENYVDFVRETGAGWQPPSTLTLTAVTATTNKHRLTTALSLSEGEVLAIDEISYKGIPLLLWDKKKIDEQYDDSVGTVAGDPYAYAFWGEYNATTHDEATYIALYPFLAANDSTNVKMTWHKKPATVTSDAGTYDYRTTYPIFPDNYSHVLAEKMAIQRLMEAGDSKLTNLRLVKYENEITKIKNHFNSYRITTLENEGVGAPIRIYFYGES